MVCKGLALRGSRYPMVLIWRTFSYLMVFTQWHFWGFQTAYRCCSAVRKTIPILNHLLFYVFIIFLLPSNRIRQHHCSFLPFPGPPVLFKNLGCFAWYVFLNSFCLFKEKENWSEIHTLRITIVKWIIPCHLVHSQSCAITASISFQNIFVSLKENFVPISAAPHFPHSQPLATTSLLSDCVNLPILDISYQWSHTICDLLCLASFARHNVFKIHPWYSMFQYFHFFL